MISRFAKYPNWRKRYDDRIFYSMPPVGVAVRLPVRYAMIFGENAISIRYHNPFIKIAHFIGGEHLTMPTKWELINYLSLRQYTRHL